MKIIHCADVHLGSSLSTNFDSKHALERQGELFKTFTRMLDFAESNDVKALIIAGDLFDKDSGIAKIKDNVFKAIAAHPGIAFYYLRGNHDNGAADEQVPANLFYFGSDWKNYELTANITLSGVELDRSNSGLIYNTLNLNEEKINLVTLHGQESKYEGGPGAEIINLAALKNKNIDYLALGHLHYYKEEALDERGYYCYSGCLEGRGFDEAGKHGFVLLDIDELMHKVKREFIPFAQREVFHETVDVSGCTNSYDAVTLLENLINNLGCQNEDCAEFILSGSLALEAEIDENFIYQQFKERFYYLRIKNKTTPLIDYQTYEQDESLKGEFARLVLNKAELSAQEQAEIVKAGLAALAGKEL